MSDPDSAGSDSAGSDSAGSDSAASDEVRGYERSLQTSERTLERFMDVSGVDNVFGEPVQQGETTVIPAAEVVSSLGFGFGFGRGSESSEAPSHEGGGGGGGGGGYAMARPVAAIVASPDGVRVESVFDLTKVALAALTAGAFMLATWLGMARPKKPRF